MWNETNSDKITRTRSITWYFHFQLTKHCSKIVYQCSFEQQTLADILALGIFNTCVYDLKCCIRIKRLHILSKIINCCFKHIMCVGRTSTIFSLIEILTLFICVWLYVCSICVLSIHTNKGMKKQEYLYVLGPTRLYD